MPELPEVEVLARHLNRVLPGRLVHEGEVFHAKAVRPHLPQAFLQAMVGFRFLGVRRRGKYLVFQGVDARGVARDLVGHLGMTGRMYVVAPEKPLPPHARVSLLLDQGRFLLVDSRIFGRLTWDNRVLQPLGPEPLEAGFTARVLGERLAGSRQPIKVRLMDQRVVAGVGNIYASEALWRARIFPLKEAGRLTPEEIRELWRALRAVLREAIRCGSTMPLDFAGQDGGEALFYYGIRHAASGRYHERLHVYDREGQPCRRCGAPIQRFTQGGRSTYWCSVCQRAGADKSRPQARRKSRGGGRRRA